MDIVERVARAIENAKCIGREGPYGLYNYSSQIGIEKPHIVRDFRDFDSPTYGKAVFSSSNEEEARDEYDRLTANHIAQAALSASGVAELVEALEEFLNVGCHVCLGDCSSSKHPVTNCPTLMARTALARYRGEA